MDHDIESIDDGSEVGMVMEVITILVRHISLLGDMS